MQLSPQALPLVQIRQQERWAPAAKSPPQSEMDSGTSVSPAVAAKIAIDLIMAPPRAEAEHRRGVGHAVLHPNRRRIG